MTSKSDESSKKNTGTTTTGSTTVTATWCCNTDDMFQHLSLDNRQPPQQQQSVSYCNSNESESIIINDITDIRANIKCIRRVLHFWFTIQQQQQKGDMDDEMTTTSKKRESTNISNNNNNSSISNVADISILQKQLWMIASSSSSQQQQQQHVDQTILQQFGGLLVQLSALSSTSSISTNSSISDSTITATATATATHITNNSNNINTSSSKSSPSLLWRQWCVDGTDVYGWEGKLAAIIVLDQFSRHIHRALLSSIPQHQQTDDNELSLSSSAATNGNNNNAQQFIDCRYIQQRIRHQSELDQLAFQTTQLLLQHHTREFYSTSIISIPIRIFAIMPLRHQSTIELVQQTQHYIDALFTQQQESCHTMIQSFRKATNRRLAVLQDEARRTGNIGENTTTGTANNNHFSDRNDNISDHIENTVQQQQQQFTDDDILECGYFVAPDDNPGTGPAHHIVYETIRNFIDQYVMGSTTSNSNANSKNNDSAASNATEENQTNLAKTTNVDSVSSTVAAEEQKQSICLSPPQHRRPVIISLSGGVDSMVICAVLAHLQQQISYHQLQIIAVHIDYANRPESYAEARYVQKYCRTILKNVTYYCRRIDEVTRGITARDTYERMARDIRYQFYRDIINKYRHPSTDSEHGNIKDSSEKDEHVSKRSPGKKTATGKNTIGVMLGHHRGDLRENVLSNSHKGCGPLDLSGMTSISNNDGVVLFRPLLPLEKSYIFDYAHTFGVPYFKDTTPHWSTRGKLRNKLLPLLEEIYGEGSMNNLSNLAVESDECRALLHNVMIQPFLDGIIYQPMGISFPTSKWITQGTFFWKIVLREALHSAGLGMFSDKSVESFMKRVCRTTIHEGWLQCRKDYGVYLRTDGFVFVLYPATFPWGSPTSVKNIIRTWTTHCTTIECGDKEAVAQVGPWTVATRRHTLNADDSHEMMERKVFATMDAFMEGVYEYWLDIPPLVSLVNGDSRSDKDQSVDVNQSQLTFTSFVKRTRPKGWKGIDPKIQDSLPLLGYVARTEDSKQNGSNEGNEPNSKHAADVLSSRNTGFHASVEKMYTRIRLSLTRKQTF